MFTAGELRILAHSTVILWGVRGIPDSLYPTKMVAEVAARQIFNGESESERYSRIYYCEFRKAD